MAPPVGGGSSHGPLTGWTVGVTAERRREELGQALERQGARVVYGPAIRIVPLADDTELRAATERCLAGPLDLVVATTGVGFRGWVEAADGWGHTTAMHDTLAAASIHARGPKVRGAVRARGLREAWSPESESTDEMLAHLLAEHDLAGRRVAVQLHGDPLREVIGALRSAGAEVIEVPVYRWLPPEDERPLLHLLESVAARTLDAVTFTSAPAAVNVLRTAAAHNLDVVTSLRDAVLCAAVGPVTAAPLVAAGIPVHQPERFRLGALVREVVRVLPGRAVTVVASGHRVEARGHAAFVDGQLVPLSGGAVALLRSSAARPGEVVRATAAAADELRAALGGAAVVETAGDGYRLAVDTG